MVSSLTKVVATKSTTLSSSLATVLRMEWNTSLLKTHGAKLGVIKATSKLESNQAKVFVASKSLLYNRMWSFIKTTTFMQET